MWWSDPSSLVTPGPDLSFNTGGASDDFYLDPLECDWFVDLRLEVQDAPRAHGVIVFPPLMGAGHLKLSGRLKPVTDTPAARNAMAQTLEAAAIALSGPTPGSFVHPRGTLVVTLEEWPRTPGGLRKSFTIGLLAANPQAWS